MASNGVPGAAAGLSDPTERETLKILQERIARLQKENDDMKEELADMKKESVELMKEQAEAQQTFLDLQSRISSITASIEYTADDLDKIGRIWDVVAAVKTCFDAKMEILEKELVGSFVYFKRLQWCRIMASYMLDELTDRSLVGPSEPGTQYLDFKKSSSSSSSDFSSSSSKNAKMASSSQQKASSSNTIDDPPEEQPREACFDTNHIRYHLPSFLQPLATVNLAILREVTRSMHPQARPHILGNVEEKTATSLFNFFKPSNPNLQDTIMAAFGVGLDTTTSTFSPKKSMPPPAALLNEPGPSKQSPPQHSVPLWYRTLFVLAIETLHPGVLLSDDILRATSYFAPERAADCAPLAVTSYVVVDPYAIGEDVCDAECFVKYPPIADDSSPLQLEAIGRLDHRTSFERSVAYAVT